MQKGVGLTCPLRPSPSATICFPVESLDLEAVYSSGREGLSNKPPPAWASLPWVMAARSLPNPSLTSAKGKVGREEERAVVTIQWELNPGCPSPFSSTTREPSLKGEHLVQVRALRAYQCSAAYKEKSGLDICNIFKLPWRFWNVEGNIPVISKRKKICNFLWVIQTRLETNAKQNNALLFCLLPSKLSFSIDPEQFLRSNLIFYCIHN